VTQNHKAGEQPERFVGSMQRSTACHRHDWSERCDGGESPGTYRRYI
jgi:hypothetical protein